MELVKYVEQTPLRHLNTSFKPWDAFILWSAFVLGTSGECALVVSERLYKAERFILIQMDRVP